MFGWLGLAGYFNLAALFRLAQGRHYLLIMKAVLAKAGRRWLLLLVLGVVFSGAVSLTAHEGHDHVPVGRWIFWPDYTLEGRAKNYPGPRTEHPRTAFEKIDAETHPLVFFGENPTERIGRLLTTNQVPREAFTAELWLVDHMNKPIGGLLTAKGRTVNDEPAWVLGYYHDQIIFSLHTTGRTNAVTLEAKPREGWKRYWYHIVGTYDGFAARLYVNGELLAESRDVGGAVRLPERAEVEAAAYLRHEPHMDLANVIREARVYEHDIGLKQIKERLARLQYMVEEGVIFSDLFHFNAGPYLNYVTPSSISIVWETDRATTATLRYGKKLPYDQSILLTNAQAVHTITLTNLEPEMNYFYEITARDEKGTEISSGNLTFKTAVREDSAYSFAVIGDTEARPHINDVIAKAVWSERPNFLLNVGDLTDGGQQHHKFEWNLEYFLGMNQLIGRIPMFPVPGNGESDLHWYNRYHVLPLPENYYSFKFGNAEFFMLDSNREMGPGTEQYAWLEKQLAASTAKWKFCAHHHPTYTSDDDDYGNSWEEPSNLGDLKVRSMVPLYEKYGVDIVFFGHLHAYERTWPIAGGRVNQQKGVRYVQAGGAGGNLEDSTPTRNWFSTKLYRGHHYCIFNIHEGYLNFKMFDSEGRMRDTFELTK